MVLETNLVNFRKYLFDIGSTGFSNIFNIDKKIIRKLLYRIELYDCNKEANNIYNCILKHEDVLTFDNIRLLCVTELYDAFVCIIRHLYDYINDIIKTPDFISSNIMLKYICNDMYINFFSNVIEKNKIKKVVNILIDIIENNFTIDTIKKLNLLEHINEGLIKMYLYTIKEVYLVYLITIVNNNYSINYIK